MKKIALKHNLVCLLHEKPFAGVNGSGKHNNWSISTDDGINLLKPGKKPYDNPLFLTFFCAVIKAVDDYQDLLRISAASAGNDHRLGGNEAPPAIVSMYIGEQLEEILDAGGRKNDRVVNIVIYDEVVINRLSKRIVCPVCGETYHLEFNPADDNMCKKCGAQLVHRDDDKPDVIRNRIAAYHRQTEPLVEFYRGKGKLMNVLSESSIEESLQNTLYALGLKGI